MLGCYFFNNFQYDHVTAKNSYHHEAHQMQQKAALQYEPPSGRYATSKIPIYFIWRSHLKHGFEGKESTNWWLKPDKYWALTVIIYKCIFWHLNTMD